MDQLLTQVPLLLLIASRMAGLTTASPIFSSRFMPTQLRVVLTLLLAFLLVPVVHPAPGMTEGVGLLVGCVYELLVGLTMGFVSLLIFTAVQVAGSLVDLDMGFMMSQIMDPVTGHADPIIGSFFQTLAVVLYFAMNAHHWLLRALADSYEVVHAGGLTLSAAGFFHVTDLFGVFLAAAVQMVLPFIAVMLLASMALAGINRAVPQMHVFAVGMGIKAVAGLAFLMVMMPYFLGFLDRLFSAGHDHLIGTLKLLP